MFGHNRNPSSKKKNPWWEVTPGLTCMSPCMSLEIEGVVEPFATEGTQVPFDFTVAFHMAIEKTLKREDFAAHLALELIVRCLNTCQVGYETEDWTLCHSISNSSTWFSNDGNYTYTNLGTWALEWIHDCSKEGSSHHSLHWLSQSWWVAPVNETYRWKSEGVSEMKAAQLSFPWPNEL